VPGLLCSTDVNLLYRVKLGHITKTHMSLVQSNRTTCTAKYYHAYSTEYRPGTSINRARPWASPRVLFIDLFVDETTLSSLPRASSPSLSGWCLASPRACPSFRVLEWCTHEQAVRPHRACSMNKQRRTDCMTKDGKSNMRQKRPAATSREWRQEVVKALSRVK